MQRESERKLKAAYWWRLPSAIFPGGAQQYCQHNAASGDNNIKVCEMKTKQSTGTDGHCNSEAQ